MADLDKAIELSRGRGKVAENAYTQRGIIRKVRGEEEEALEDFKKAAYLGSSFAHRQVSCHLLKISMAHVVGMVSPAVMNLKHRAYSESSVQRRYSTELTD